MASVIIDEHFCGPPIPAMAVMFCGLLRKAILKEAGRSRSCSAARGQPTLDRRRADGGVERTRTRRFLRPGRAMPLAVGQTPT